MALPTLADGAVILAAVTLMFGAHRAVRRWIIAPDD